MERESRSVGDSVGLHQVGSDNKLVDAVEPFHPCFQRQDEVFALFQAQQPSLAGQVIEQLVDVLTFITQSGAGLGSGKDDVPVSGQPVEQAGLSWTECSCLCHHYTLPVG